MSKIPAKIHLTFLNSQEPYPDLFLTCLERMKSLHPSWEIRVYHEQDAREILGKYFPRLLDVYHSYGHTVQRSDLLRVLLVYLFGGFYLDLDMFCLKELDELRCYTLVLGQEKIISREEARQLGLRHRDRVANYMFGSVPLHPFWLRFIREMIGKSVNPILSENDILESTGPGLLTNVYHSCRHSYKDITFLKNKDRLCLREGHMEVSCHFGNYAAHLHQGSWRKPSNPLPYLTVCGRSKELVRDALSYIDGMVQGGRTDRGSTATLKIGAPPSKELVHLHDLYSRFRLSGVGHSSVKGDCHTMLTFGSPVANQKWISQENRNILYAAMSDRLLKGDWVTSLNTCYHGCLVPDGPTMDFFRSSGVRLPIKVIPLGFKRCTRPWDVENVLPSKAFTIGFSGVGYPADLEKVVIACERLRQGPIPELVLHLLVTGKGGKSLEKYRRMEWIKLAAPVEDMCIWYNGLNCYISVNPEDLIQHGPMQSLYMGIPTLLSRGGRHEALIRAGFYGLMGKDAPFEGVIGKEGSLLTPEDIAKSLEELYTNYEAFDERAVEGAYWIEDKWTNEQTRQEIMNFLNQESDE